MCPIASLQRALDDCRPDAHASPSIANDACDAKMRRPFDWSSDAAAQVLPELDPIDPRLHRMYGARMSY
jgi:hypothetical protein